MENEIKFVKLHKHNLREYFNRLDGNIYFKTVDSESFEVADDFTYSDLLFAYNVDMVKLIWIEGQSLGTNVKVDY